MSFIIATRCSQPTSQTINSDPILSQSQRITAVIDFLAIALIATYAILALCHINPIHAFTISSQHAYIMLAAGSGGLLFIDLITYVIHLYRRNILSSKAALGAITAKKLCERQVELNNRALAVEYQKVITSNQDKERADQGLRETLAKLARLEEQNNTGAAQLLDLIKQKEGLEKRVITMQEIHTKEHASLEEAKKRVSALEQELQQEKAKKRAETEKTAGAKSEELNKQMTQLQQRLEVTTKELTALQITCNEMQKKLEHANKNAMAEASAFWSKHFERKNKEVLDLQAKLGTQEQLKGLHEEIARAEFTLEEAKLHREKSDQEQIKHFEAVNQDVKMLEEKRKKYEEECTEKQLQAGKLQASIDEKRKVLEQLETQSRGVSKN